jgi:hypothetical protein
VKFSMEVDHEYVQNLSVIFLCVNNYKHGSNAQFMANLMWKLLVKFIHMNKTN